MERGITTNIDHPQTQCIKRENACIGYTSPSVNNSEDPFEASAVPAHQGCDDDAPRRTAAVSIEMFFALPMAATQPERVEEEEEQVQSEAGERDAAQQQQGLRETQTASRPTRAWP